MTSMVAGALIHNKYIDNNGPVPPHRLAQIVEDTDFSLNIQPTVPIIKMSKGIHVDKFFADGSIRLGTFEYFNKYDHPEIGDSTEGRFILIGRDQYSTAFAEVKGGFEYYAFCCFAGELSQDCIAKFTYDAAFEIINVKGFAKAVQKALSASARLYGKCLYSKDRAVRGFVPNGYDFSQISGRIIEMASEAKYFLKPTHLAHQSEFRFLWRMKRDCSEYIDLKVPEAIKHCRRIK